jgi:putative flippase GtrA
MLAKAKQLLKKYHSLVSYVFFGGLTTAVNYLVYLPLYNFAGLSGAVSNVIAWAAAVVFAYFTNKPFVFNSHDWSCKTVLPELGKFVGCRVMSGLVETVLIWIAVDMYQLNGNLIKLLVGVLVLILNYLGSKLLVFRKK